MELTQLNLDTFNLANKLSHLVSVAGANYLKSKSDTKALTTMGRIRDPIKKKLDEIAYTIQRMGMGEGRMVIIGFQPYKYKWIHSRVTVIIPHRRETRTVKVCSTEKGYACEYYDQEPPEVMSFERIQEIKDELRRLRRLIFETKIRYKKFGIM